MSRVALAVQSMSVAGLNAITFTSPNSTGTGNGNTVAGYDKSVFVLVLNTGTSATTATVTVPNQTTAADNGVVIPGHTQAFVAGNSGIVWVPAQFYNDSAGTLAIDTDATVGLTWAAIKVPVQYV